MKSFEMIFAFCCCFFVIIDPIWSLQQHKNQQSQPHSPVLPPGYEDYEGFDPNDPNGGNPSGGSAGGGLNGGINGPDGKLNENFSGESLANLNGDPNIDPKSFEDIEQDGNPAKTRFSDERFAKLFPSRAGNKLNGRFDDRRLNVKEIAKPKPTLPSFIKSTPPLMKVQITTPSSRNIFAQNRQRSVATPRLSKSTTTTTTTPRPGNRNRSLNSRQTNQLTGRLQTSTTSAPNNKHHQTTSTTISPALAAARRRYNSSSSRFSRNNNNSTIPALNPRGRN